LSFEIQGLSGARVFRLRQPASWMLKSVRASGRDVTDTPLEFGTPAQSTDDLEIVVTDRIPELSGRVFDQRGRPVPRIPVLVFSVNRDLWAAPSRFLYEARSGKDGSFEVRRLPPGEYFVIALATVADDWQDPERLESFVPFATRVTVDDGQTPPVALRVNGP
jgi:hypothetical protein